MPWDTAESVMCDVIKISLKRKDERRSGKGNPLKKIWIIIISFLTSHISLSAVPCLGPKRKQLIAMHS